jgi:hypothetical protein
MFVDFFRAVTSCTLHTYTNVSEEYVASIFRAQAAVLCSSQSLLHCLLSKLFNFIAVFWPIDISLSQPVVRTFAN